MTRITFEADHRLLEAARQTAAAESATLGDKFREWLKTYAQSRERGDAIESDAEWQARVAEWNAISKTVDSGGRKFTREEMNAR